MAKQDKNLNAGDPQEAAAKETAAKEAGENLKDTADGGNSVIKEVLSWVEVIVVAIALALLLNNFIIINARVPSGSMENTIQPGDRLLGLRLTYLWSEPQRGDIVVFRYPIDEAQGHKTNFIKRIIGLPGETVEIRDAKVYIDGSETPLDEPYLKDEWRVLNDGITFKVPEGCYLMLGDNRNNSKDARYWASEAYSLGLADTPEEAWNNFTFIKRGKILGKAYVRYWPLNKISSLY